MMVKYNVPARARRTYPILVKENALTELPTILHELKDVDRFFILYDQAVEKIAHTLESSCKPCGLSSVKTGEHSKCLAEVERLSAELFLHGMTAQSVLIIVGGGVAMDLGTFVAGVYAGGIRFIHVPTNLMAMADAAFGGRGYLDVGTMKNLVSVAHHPSGVVVDLTVLRELPDALMRAGLVEIVKIAATSDAEFFGWLCEHMDAILDHQATVLETCVTNAVRLKAELGQNETDEVRLLSTYGHTVGQALEALTQFSISHAEAVAIGMICEAKMANSPATAEIRTCLERLHMPLSLPLEIHTKSLWDIMQRDRKVRNGQVRIAVPKAIGSGELRAVTLEDLARGRM